MTPNVQKIFATYLKISKKEQSRITTPQLNVLYNIYRRTERDPEYAAELKKFDTGLGDDIASLINKYDKMHFFKATEYTLFTSKEN